MIRTAVAAGLLLSASCTSPMLRPLDNRQDPDRFESCADSEGRAAYESALVELQAGHDTEALPLLRRVVERCPENVLAHGYYQDAALHVGGDTAAAMRRYYEELADDPASPVPGYAKARLLDSNYQRMAAIEAVLARHPDFAWAHLAAARLNRSRGQLAEAVESYRRAIARYPQLLAAHLELAEVLTELGRTAEAQLPYENYLRGAPSDRSTVREYVHLLLYALNKPDEARPWVDRLLKDDPEDEAARMDLAATLWRSSHFDEALQAYVDVLTRRPDNARAVLNIAYMHYDAFAYSEDDKRAHWPKARQAFRLFLQLVRPEDGYDYFEKVLAVPYRLKEIEAFLGPAPEGAPTIESIR